MEIYLAGIGTPPYLNGWLNDLRAVKLPYRDKRGEVKHYIKLGVAELKIVKLIFPEEHEETVISMMGIGTEEGHVFKRNPMLKKIVGTIRRMIGLKKIKYPKKILEHMQPPYMAIFPIGMKKDNYDENGIEVIWITKIIPPNQVGGKRIIFFGNM